MAKVTAISNFEHGGQRRCGDQFTVSDAAAIKLRDKGLVTINGDVAVIHERPMTAAGAPSSASRAAQASPQATVKKSEPGGKKGKANGPRS